MSLDLQSVKPSIARVALDDGGKPAADALGTAFFVGKNYALSALHVVVADVRADPPTPRATTFWLDFTEAGHQTQARIVAQDAVDDWVILECTTPPRVTPLEPAPLPAAEAPWWTFGYPAINPAGQIIKGKVTDPLSRDPLTLEARRAQAIQLWCDEAAAGTGAPLHGYSGAPCLSDDGKVLGLLRSTLTTTALDGQGRPQLLTQGGTVFACPAGRVVDRGEPSRALSLPGAWSRAPTSDFIVVISSKEASAKQKLVSVARSAHQKLPALGLGEPRPLAADRAIETIDQLLDAVRELCAARVALFDATDFEPAVMLLLGIRAAVRRGVTILSIGGKYTLGDRIDVPFNLLDANIVSHSHLQEKASDERTRPVALLARRIEHALRRIESPFHFDLPVFEAVRRLPAERRGIRPAQDGVLVLCSFAPKYTKSIWSDSLKPALKDQLDNYNAQRTDGSRDVKLGVARSFELNSPQLVSRAIYEEIRRSQACVADLTDWPSSVLFELGVRLAVSPHPTTCVIEASAPPRKGTEAQCRALLELLVPGDLRYDVSRNYLDEPAFARMYGPRAVARGMPAASGAVYECIERNLQVDAEPAARPVYEELLDSASLFARTSSGGGVTKPVGLFPANTALTRLEENAEFERLLATWFFLSRYQGKEKLFAEQGGVRRAAEEVVTALLERHQRRVGEVDGLQRALEKMQQAFAAKAAETRGGFDEMIGLKRSANALRKSGQLQQARKLLDVVLDGLKGVLAEHRDDARLTAQIRAELADTYGMRGGVNRRLDDLTAALADYEQGLSEEEAGSQSTYNLGNVIMLSITVRGTRPDDAVMKKQIDDAIDRLQKQTSAGRGDEWWALADLGQFHLLRGDLDDASAAYARGLRTGPPADEVERHIELLRELGTAVAQHDAALGEHVRSFAEKLEAELR